MAVCLSCGAPLRDGARFCTECGARQDVESAAPVMEMSTEAPVFPEPPMEPEIAETEIREPFADGITEAAEAPAEPETAPFAQPAFDAAMLEPEAPAPVENTMPEPAPVSPVPPIAVPAAPAAPVIPDYPPRPAAKPLDPDRPGKKSKYAPMTSVGIALQLVLMSIPVVGFILMILWSCGVCRKITRRNLARGYLILFIVGLVLLIIGALLLRFVFAEAFTGIFEELFPGYTIQWG